MPIFPPHGEAPFEETSGFETGLLRLAVVVDDRPSHPRHAGENVAAHHQRQTLVVGFQGRQQFGRGELTALKGVGFSDPALPHLPATVHVPVHFIEGLHHLLQIALGDLQVHGPVVDDQIELHASTMAPFESGS